MSIATLLSCLAALSGCGARDPASVSVFPVPGSRMATPRSQIVFRGVPVNRLGRVVVSGSRTGRHRGRFRADSDGAGGSFVPAKPFSPGETVTVRSGVTVAGGKGKTFRFSVARPAAPIQAAIVVPAPRMAGDVDSFRSRPDLQPPAVEIMNPQAGAQPGDIFLANQVGPLQDGPLIIDPGGTVVWFHPLPKGLQATDFRVQEYGGQQVLTWWQGKLSTGIGLGHGVIYDSSYRQIATVYAGNGLTADLHEFQLTPAGTALITAYYPVDWTIGSGRAAKRAVVIDCVVQEVDIKTGLVVFQWDSLDHVPVSESEVPVPASTSIPYDYFHVNSVQAAQDGSLIVSARNTWAAYKVDHRSGRVIWRLGGKRSTFKLSAAAKFAFQHDVRLTDTGGEMVSVFDDGAGPPSVHRQSRAMLLTLDERAKVAKETGELRHSPPLLANFEGNFQPLAGGHYFVGWGQQPYFTEFDPVGRTVFDGRFVDANTSYRAYRFPWTASPRTAPRVVVSRSGSAVTVYASWNGATEVASWRLLAGASPGALQPGAGVAKAGFETALGGASQPYVAAQALDATGRVLGTSAVTHVG